MIDVTLACEDDNSKLVDVVTVAGEDRVGNNLLQILKLRFGQKTFVHTLSTRFGQDFEVEVQARFEAGVWSIVMKKYSALAENHTFVCDNTKVWPGRYCKLVATILLVVSILLFGLAGL